mmetsp:Transcript_9335/g.13502  ORF Transcript_9335/g.13502 Transcript_9335/m.13502 type:complete len:646 (+) Transcript_9335:367-2304(+)
MSAPVLFFKQKVLPPYKRRRRTMSSTSSSPNSNSTSPSPMALFRLTLFTVLGTSIILVTFCQGNMNCVSTTAKIWSLIRNEYGQSFLFLLYNKIRYGSERPSSESPYRIVIDGGSTGSRLHIFEFQKDSSTNLTTCIRKGSDKIYIPISTFAQNITSSKITDGTVAQHLLPLFSYAASIIPPQYHTTTTIHYQATAGMRLIEPKVQKAVYDSLYQGLLSSDSFVFTNLQRRDIATLGGEKEALYGAVAANYLKGVVDVNLHMIGDEEGDHLEYYDGPLGALDMGGASMQIVYLPHIDDVLEEGEIYKEVEDINDDDDAPMEPLPSLPDRLNGEEFFSTSYLSYGADQFRERLWNTLVKEHEREWRRSSHIDSVTEGDDVHSNTIENPCSFRGYTSEWKGHILIGSGNARKCAEEVNRLIPHHEKNTEDSDENEDLVMESIGPSRIVGGVEHPPIRGHFFAMSLFFFTLDCLRELSGHKLLNKHWPTPSIADLTSALDSLCSRHWSNDLELIQENSHEFTRAKVLPDRCLESVYMVTLLRDGFGFEPESRDITFTYLVDGSEVEWSLGLAISHFAEEHSPAVSILTNADRNTEAKASSWIACGHEIAGIDDESSSSSCRSYVPMVETLNFWMINGIGMTRQQSRQS